MHETQDYITLTEATKLAPGRPSVNCIWRWARRGMLARNGERVHLEHVRIGGKLFTTEAWLSQFGQALAEADASYFKLDDKPTVLVSSPRGRSDKERQAAIEKAERELKEMGL